MRVDVKMNHGGARALLSSPGTRALVADQAQAIAQRAGRGYEHDVWQGSSRVVASAFTATPEAMRREARDHRLLRSLRG